MSNVLIGACLRASTELAEHSPDVRRFFSPVSESRSTGSRSSSQLTSSCAGLGTRRVEFLVPAVRDQLIADVDLLMAPPYDPCDIRKEDIAVAATGRWTREEAAKVPERLLASEVF